MFDLAESMGLVLEHSKSEVFHFLHSSWEVNPLIDLGYAPFTGDTPLVSKDIWRYLDFFFDCALTISEHMRWYSNKAMTSVRAMFALGNSACGLTSSTNVFSIGPVFFRSLPMELDFGISNAPKTRVLEKL